MSKGSRRIADGYIVGVAPAEEAAAKIHARYPAACYDCLRPYGDEHGFPDLIIPDWAWRKISPTGHEGGLLCPSCICKRLHLAGIANVPSVFTSGPLVFDVKGWIR